MSGKGSKQRPLSISKAQFEENWDRIFKKKVKVYFEEVKSGEVDFSCEQRS